MVSLPVSVPTLVSLTRLSAIGRFKMGAVPNCFVGRRAAYGLEAAVLQLTDAPPVELSEIQRDLVVRLFDTYLSRFPALP